MNFFALKAFQGFSEIPLLYWGFPDSSVGKESACNAGDPGSIPELGRSCGEGNGYSLQYSGLENSMGSLYSPWGHKEADTTEKLSLHFTSLLLYCTPQAHKSCSCPALGPNKKPGDSNRNIESLLDTGILHKGPGVTPHCAQQAGDRM